MAFVHEKIPQDILDTFDFSIFKDFYGGTFYKNPGPNYSWTRDKDRDAFLINTGGYGPRDGIPREDLYALWWKGDVVYFRGEEVNSRDDECQVLTWTNTHLNIPDPLLPRRAEFIALVKEALTVRYSRNYPADPKNSTKVVVELI